ncbi:MAG: phospho-N-acetylmuramoyl-pentapeptide-transferase [Sphingobacteriales bacterium 17-39-43]|jgi:phospho-N-acetylmuramoyl-pentapeptide-transferase|uniref:phospho-N-acetylmuramoyl-pentapeptide- transferase n=1 Tax=Daejeonella sp. TaxID=2805397 RepID=UPI000BDA13FE|nr:phospho-N-acetylmuramoyl-pentapeptide-transferase [Daejeonella sp.]OYY05923.1 MAG: phospho-N-acetylmuramoyl-pentapeptide-transferase [Sphingobacteriia bacterium 35-40-5]OYZ29087.1 MAG: phospho-N-acetylmuramoyl-pentapeptide-transferase [Sphingobacteriales bacterium 16-39-50]OZA23088.1 MAG: phospho-N-acetylmuramoyl-pentapeptide-transferase [Sphingobacteriales bacterium 17-39-43]OZA62224.1 MAG: phospho-N-acetylmuramoyl-pentapeptide-transferase [Sphingobacteriales bacterium 39-40-5]MDP2413156.1
MLYYLFTWLDKQYDIPGAGLFQFISFRTAMAVILSLILTTVYGSRLIRLLRAKQVGESVRNLGLEGQMQKQGTPTMGGLIILLGILLPTILFAKIDNIYIILMLVTTVWMGLIGFVDDYIKVFKKDKEGLAGRFKIMGQVGLALIIGWTMYFHPDIVVREQVTLPAKVSAPLDVHKRGDQFYYTQDLKSTITNVPFYKDNEFDYAKVLTVFGDGYEKYSLVVFLLFVIVIVTAVSNGANLTDGIDGLATGTSAIIGITLAILAYVSGNTIFADYLNIMYIPNSGELVIFAGAFVGACVGFLWYNSYPAQVFMGDTGSLAIGGIIAAFAIMIRKELLIPALCGVFLVENLSVIMQVSYFKYTKRKFGEGRRIFLMSPLHHHYQKKGYHEAKIVTRFWIVGILLAIITIVTLKLR